MIALPSYIDPELWSLFVDGRKESKHPLTQAGQKIAVRKLMRLHSDGWDVNASLEDSIYKGYRGLFPVAKIAVEPTQKPLAVQVTDEHKARATPMPENLRRMIKTLG